MSSNLLHNEEFNLPNQLLILFGYGILTLFGYVLDWFDTLTGKKKKPIKGFAPITRDFEEFYRRRMYARIADAFNRPITGPAGGRVKVLERDLDTLELTGKEVDALNLSSYNYLGFAEPGGCTEKHVLETLDTYGVSTTSAPIYAGYTALHKELEHTVADFIGVEDSMVFGMGWGTNTTAIPALVGRGCLVVSDSINHNSIVVGARSSGARIKPFPHNNVARLESIVRKAIIDGQPRTHRPWKKILIIVEGVYSMEGEICDLEAIVRIKKKYKCYLYLDEAHSIGAIGPTGRGVCEMKGVNPNDIDVLMGTFTKSFGAIGGYCAGSKRLIAAIRHVCASHLFSAGLSPPCVAQVLGAFRHIMSDEGQKRVQRLIRNSNLFRSKLEKRGLHVLGHYDSAVIPVLIGNPAKISAFSRLCLDRGLAVVVVGFPATPLLTSRARFCISAAHTEKEILEAVDIITEVADIVHIRYQKSYFG